MNRNTHYIDQKLENIKHSVIKAESENLTSKERKHKEWMIEEILQLMCERKS